MTLFLKYCWHIKNKMGWNSLHSVCMEGKTNDIEEEIMKKGLFYEREKLHASIRTF
jgi:L-rhamnose isomerase